MGFDFAEPDETMPVPYGNVGNAFGVDSTFRVTLMDGVTPVCEFTFSAEDDVISFVGVWSDAAFDRVSIRELVGGIDDEYFGQFYAGTIPCCAPEPVVIDIKPGSDPNAINPRSKGVIPVAILTTDTFDAQSVDPSTVQFGPSSADIASFVQGSCGANGWWRDK